jgi:hypothetical protein
LQHLERRCREHQQATKEAQTFILQNEQLAAALDRLCVRLVAEARAKASERLASAQAAIVQGQRLSVSILEELEKASMRCVAASLFILTRVVVRVACMARRLKRPDRRMFEGPGVTV